MPYFFITFAIMKNITLTIIALLATTFSTFAIDYEKEFSQYGFVDIQSLDSTIVVELKYSTTDNFMGVNMYGDLKKAYLRPEIAAMVVEAQRILKNINPDYTLVIYDAARPLSAQKSMFDKVKGTEFEQYVANPYGLGGFHNYGCAVDLTILYKGQPLDMGTEFDSFDSLSNINNENENLKNGTLSQEAYDNRQLLRRIMKKVGFHCEIYEWWHYDYYTKKQVHRKFKILDF